MGTVFNDKASKPKWTIQDMDVAPENKVISEMVEYFIDLGPNLIK